jgi:hypothetical protein
MATSPGKALPLLLATTFASCETGPDVSELINSSNGVVRKVAEDYQTILRTEDVGPSDFSTGNGLNRGFKVSIPGTQDHYLSDTLTYLCRDNLEAEMQAGEAVGCSSQWSPVGPHAAVQHSVSVRGVLEPIPDGAVMDPIAGSTSPNDGMYIVSYGRTCGSDMYCYTHLMIDPTAETATIEAVSYRPGKVGSEGDTYEISVPTQSVGFGTAMEMREAVIAQICMHNNCDCHV